MSTVRTENPVILGLANQNGQKRGSAKPSGGPGGGGGPQTAQPSQIKASSTVNNGNSMPVPTANTVIK